MERLHLTLAALAISVAAGRAGAAVIPTDAAGLAKALAVAVCGDTLALAPGAYGDSYVGRKCPVASPITITSADLGNLATFRTLTIYQASGVAVDHVRVALTPDAQTKSFSAALAIKASTDIAISAVQVTSGPAVNGIDPATAQAQDATGNVRGFPAGYGVNVYQSQRVTLQGLEVSQVDRGVNLSGVQDVAVLGSHIHDTRRTPILGGDLQRVTISGNQLSDVHPWAFGETARQGDHVDMLALWTTPTMMAPSDRITVSRNLMKQGGGAAGLGFWMQGAQGGKVVGFTHTEITGNVIEIANTQAVMLSQVWGGVVASNVMLQTSGDPLHQMPGIRLQPGTVRLDVHGNMVSFISDVSGSTGSDANLIGPNDVASLGVQPAAIQALAARLVTDRPIP
jgi:hypothetical protein